DQAEQSTRYRRCQPRTQICAGLRPAEALRSGDLGCAVGKPRGLVQAVVLHVGADSRLDGLAARARALLLLPAGAPGCVVAEAERERGRPRRDGQGDLVALL